MTLPNQMLAVFKKTPEKGVVLENTNLPTPQKGELLAKVIHSSICGTDVGIYDWIPWAADHITPPTIIGHEVVAEVIEINSDAPTHIKVGDLVSSETHIFCDNCHQCSIGNKHICENLSLFGIGRNGSFAQYVTIPIRTSWVNDPRISIESMSVQEPLGNAVHVATKANVADKRVLVIGLGPTGLCAGAASHALGASEVIGIDPHPYRQNLGEKMAFDKIWSTLPENEHKKFEVVLEMSGHPAGVATAFEAVSIAGTLIAFGIPKVDISFNWGKQLIDKELTIHSIFGRKIWETWEQTSKLLVEKKVDLSPIITHRLPLSSFEEAMSIMKSGDSGKILLDNQK